jgi:hypothetical protein
MREFIVMVKIWLSGTKDWQLNIIKTIHYKRENEKRFE